MFLKPLDTSDLISIVAFTFAVRRHLIRLASKLGLVPFADHVRRRQRSIQNTEFTVDG